MKRTFAKRSFRMLAAMFFLVSGLLLTANSAGAQTLNGQSNLNWVGSAEAQTTLAVQVQSLTTLVGTQIPGSQQYNDINVRILYYKNVYRFVSEGDAVSTAVPRTTLYMGAHGVQGDASTVGMNISKSLLATIETEATDLLSN